MNLQDKANEIRLRTFESIYSAGGGHYGGSLSAIEILTCLYYRLLRYRVNEPGWPERDIFILAKGHAGPPLYTILADCGFFDPERLKELDKNGGTLPKHVDRKKVEGIEYSSGPLGQGLSVAVGAALASRLKNCDSYTYVLTGDGELDEGQVWEAAMTAAKYHLNRLTVFVDRNRCQIDGTTEAVMDLEPLDQKWAAFGWHVQIVDGHDTEAICTAAATAEKVQDKPSVIIANTIKGKGVPFMEGQYKWHSGQITEEQYEAAHNELERRCAIK